MREARAPRFEGDEGDRYDDPVCPSSYCSMCTGEACNKCGAGCWNPNAPHCEHDVAERHETPERSSA